MVPQVPSSVSALPAFHMQLSKGDIAFQLLSGGFSIRTRVFGGCMRPDFETGQAVTLKPWDGQVDSLRGRIAAFRVGRGSVELHRVVTVGPDHVITKSNVSPVADPPIDFSRIVGIVDMSSVSRLHRLFCRVKRYCYLLYRALSRPLKRRHSQPH